MMEGEGERGRKEEEEEEEGRRERLAFQTSMWAWTPIEPDLEQTSKYAWVGGNEGCDVHACM